MSRPMGRRYGKASVANVQAIETIIEQVGNGFVPKNDPFQELAREIEKCSRKIWQCVGETNEKPQHQSKKARTLRAEEALGTKPAAAPSASSQIVSEESDRSNDMDRNDFETILNVMKYKEIQAECKKYGLNAAGTKNALRERLLAHLMEQDSEAQDNSRTDQPSEQATEMDAEKEEPKQVDPIADNDFEMSDEAIEGPSSEPTAVERAVVGAPIPLERAVVVARVEVEKAVVAEPARVSSSSSIQAQVDEPMPEESQEEETSDSMEEELSKDPPGKSIPETKKSKEVVAAPSPSKSPAPSASRAEFGGIVKSAMKSISESAKKLRDHPSDSIPEDDVSPPPSDLTSSSVSASSRVREIVSKFSNPNPSNFSNPNPSSSALSKSVQAKKEARMARMAEMREKSQQAKMLSASKSGMASTEPTSSRKNLAAQMREKALRKENAPANQMSAAQTNSSAVKRAFPISHATVPDSLGTTLKSGGLGSTLKFGGQAAKKAKAPSPPRAPKETYEISDREDSDSDDSEEENEKNKKQIPSWAKRDKLLPALEAQYLGKGVDGGRVDPDAIFSEVDTCNLEAIFGSKMNQKYRTRTSSGNWDRVSAAEKLVYKRTMGF